MRRQSRRCLEFDQLEQMTLLSGIHAPGLGSPAVRPHHGLKALTIVALTTIKKGLAKLESAGISNVSITTLYGAPGAGVEYQVQYTQNGVQQTQDIWVPYRTPHRPGAPVPG